MMNSICLDRVKFEYFVYLFALLPLLHQMCSAQNPADMQKVVLYTETQGKGASLTVTEGAEPNLAVKNFDNKAKSACVTGIWIFYENAFFNTGNNGLVEFLHGAGGFCVNMAHTSGKVSSVRLAGWPKNGNANTITLYEDDYFQGNQEYIQGDQAQVKLDKKATSLIITGMSAWTVYTEANFTGASVCIIGQFASAMRPAFVYDVATVEVPQKSIRSVKLGCQGDKKVTAQ